MFVNYDKKGKLGPIFHTSFEDPNSPRDAPERESIEVRAIACFDKFCGLPRIYEVYK